MRETTDSTICYAIAADGEVVAPHFGRCERYMLVEITDGRETARRELDNPGHEPGLLPRLLAEHGVHYVVAGGAGPRAVALLNRLNIGFLPGVTGEIETAVADLVAGHLETGASICEH